MNQSNEYGCIYELCLYTKENWNHESRAENGSDAHPLNISQNLICLINLRVPCDTLLPKFNSSIS